MYRPEALRKQRPHPVPVAHDGLSVAEGTNRYLTKRRTTAMNTTYSHRWQAVLLGAVLASTLSAGPVTAVMLHDPVLPPPSAAAHAPTSRPCWLSRVGTLFVRCDNVTGNAVQAPRWVAQRSQAPYDA